MGAKVLALTALLCLTALASPQVKIENPVLAECKLLAFRGAPSAKAPSASPGQFKPAAKPIRLAKYVADITDDKDEAEALTGYFTTALEVQSDWGKANKAENDFIAAVTNATVVAALVTTGKEASDAAALDLLKNLRAGLDVPAVRNAKDSDKQEIYEVAVCHGALILLIATAAKTEEDLKPAQVLAAAVLEELLGVVPDDLVIGSDTFTIKPNGKKPEKTGGTTPPAATAGLAPGFAYGKPAGWQQQGAWLVKEVPAVSTASETFAVANVRFPNAIPASGNVGAALFKLWDEVVPAELKGKAGGMVYRRYLGDGLMGSFIFGKGLENGRKSETVFTLYLIDCKTYWQPVVVGQTYVDRTQYKTGESFSAQFSYPKSAETAEELLATLVCPAGKGLPLVTMDSLAGDYQFGSGSTMDYVNLYSGATSMAYVSYGGELFLKPDGTFTYSYSSASSNGGLASFGSATGKGRWTLEGDIVTCKFSQYEQGQGNVAGKEYKYRVAGLTVFADGTKVAVLLDDLKAVPNTCSVGDSSDWYSTDKKGSGSRH